MGDRGGLEVGPRFEFGMDVGFGMEDVERVGVPGSGAGPT